MTFLVACKVSIDSSPRAHFETEETHYDVIMVGSKSLVGRVPTWTGTSAYNACWISFCKIWPKSDPPDARLLLQISGVP